MRYILLSLFLLLAGQYIQARHIVGGVMTYRCLGNDNYEFTLLVYRDCNCSDCAEFDPRAEIGVYRCNAAGACPGQSQAQPFREISVPLLSSIPVPVPDYPCLVPPNVCGEEGMYQFTLNLPRSQDSYFVSYQRCCRNVTVTNIINSGGVGATYGVEILPAAQAVCNSSPVFDTYPPIVICANEPLSYDHSATDIDGDQLVYEFVPIIDGAGPSLDPLFYNTCNGANPIPSCPPPYGTATFQAPNYTAVRPMAGNPVVSINALNGLITGTPTIQGQFLVGIQVSEFRNGQLLSRTYRDFQFNVANCQPTVVADIREDIQIGPQRFVVNSCGDFTINFVNQSFQRSFIDNFRWTFSVGNNQTVASSDWDPTVTFPGVGNYQGMLILNENTNCGDTAEILVNIYPEIAADFSFAYDTCVAGPVAFTDLSTTGSCCLTNWDWTFGDGHTSTAQNPLHDYRIPGSLPVTLTVRDTNACEAQRTHIVDYFPVPALIVIAPSEAVACQPANIFFDNLSFPIDSTYDILWTFGDGGTSSDISPTHAYTDPGLYTVSVSITSPIGCEIDTTFTNLITVLPSPQAGFTYAPDQPSNLFPQVQFTDASQGASRWAWDFGVPPGSTFPSPVFTFPDTGLYLVQQIVYHPSGCTDTAQVVIDVIPEIRYYLPNAFTPNGDGLNDDFKGKGLLAGITNFQFTIWNRWGEPVFETTDPFLGWNGRKHNSGQEMPPGAYLVVVTFLDSRGQRTEMKGYATLIR